jgi:hypothetical protein
MPQSEANLGKGRKELLLSENFAPQSEKAAILAGKVAFQCARSKT